MDWIIGCAGSLMIAGAAYYRQALSGSGFFAAVLLGTVFYACGSLPWFGTLLAFFISSTILSHWKQELKEKINTVYEKGARRDAGQVAANGGAALFLCIAHTLWPHPLWWFAFIGTMASVTADTWATESAR